MSQTRRPNVPTFEYLYARRPLANINLPARKVRAVSAARVGVHRGIARAHAHAKCVLRRTAMPCALCVADAC